MYPINNLLQACHITANAIYHESVSELEKGMTATKSKTLKRQTNTKLNTIRKEYKSLLDESVSELDCPAKLFPLIEDVLIDLEGGTYGRIDSPIQGNM